jgi:hypothetical protein
MSKISVSIITINQLVRFQCIKVLHEMIKKQTYSNIIEWVIVEGSDSKEKADLNKENILNFKKECNININYIEYTGPKKLGGLRNLGNTTCKGDIIVCMDDDDYYPPQRVEEAVAKLSTSSCDIGGVSDVYLYDFFMDKLYKFKGFMEYHSTNNCMAFKRDYVKKYKHDENVHVGEERSFTNEFRIPLVKLDSRKTIIAISHNFNTFNKRELCLGGSLKTLHTLVEIEEPITNYIDPEIYYKMKANFYVEEDSIYDIAYLLGGFTLKFNPKDKCLTEAEVGIVKLMEYFKSKDMKTVVYGDFETPNINYEETNLIYNGVTYIHWKKFPFNHTFKTLILGRSNGFLSGALFPIKAEKIYLDLHDNVFGNNEMITFYKKYGYKVNKIFFKSIFHKNEFEKLLGTVENYEIISNGIRIDKFAKNIENVQRNPYRFCYNNFYDRGIEYLLRDIFTIIKKIEPRAELHIYTGMDMISDTNFKNKMSDLFINHGVGEHGKQSVDIIAREKHMSCFELYISNIVNEVDCISIKESIVAGCIPLIANFGVFIEREGIKFDINHEDQKGLQKIALNILNLIKDQNKLNEIRELYKKSPTILSWEQVGDLWMKAMR